jgi:DNA-binding GntR family transcriptional regulator
MSVTEARDAPAHGETVGHIVELLRDDILARRLTPGARLVEFDLTERFEVSRGPVREALRRLAAEGLIEHVPNRGAVVRRLSRREIGELFAIRTELEALAARLAAEAPDEAPRAEFARAIRPVFEERDREAAAYFTENAEFHAAIMQLGGNRQLRDVALRLQLPLIISQARDSLTASVLDDSVREHRQLATAILAHDAAAADAAIRAHLSRACALALAHIED